MDCSVRAATVRVVVPVILDEVAVMFADPDATAVASPVELIVTTPVLEDFHVTPLVMSFVLPSEYVPVAAN